MNETKTTRYVWVDVFRTLVVLGVVLAHAAQIYSYRFSVYAFVADRHFTLIGDWIYVILNPLTMPFLFVISGYFVLDTYQKHGVSGYMMRRMMRLGVPFIIGFSLITPVLRYANLISKSNWQGSFIDFYLNDYWIDYLSAASYWTLGYLLILTAIVLCMRGIFTMSPPPFFRRHFFLSIWVLVTTSLFLGHFFWGSLYWVSFFKVIQIQGARLFLLALCFLGGAFARGQNALKTLESGLKHPFFIPIGTVLGGISYSVFCLNMWAFDQAQPLYDMRNDWNQWAITIIRCTIHSTYVICAFFTLLMIARHFFKNPRGFLACIGNHSFGIYVVHSPIIVWMAYGMGFWTAGPPALKLIIAFTASAVLSILLCHLFDRVKNRVF